MIAYESHMSILLFYYFTIFTCSWKTHFDKAPNSLTFYISITWGVVGKVLQWAFVLCKTLRTITFSGDHFIVKIAYIYMGME
jgi:hypothetical protein